MKMRYFAYAGIGAIIAITFAAQSRDNSPDPASNQLPGLQQELEKRTPRLAVRSILPGTEVIEGCEENFGHGPCIGAPHVHLLGPHWIADSGLTKHHEKLASELAATIGNPNSLASRETCSANEIAKIDKLFDTYLAIEAAKGPSIFPFTNTLQKCTHFPSSKTNHDTGQNVTSHEFRSHLLVVRDGRFAGQIECRRLSYVPNPGCQFRLYDQSGKFKLTMSPVKSGNLSRTIDQLDEITRRFAQTHKTEINKFMPLDAIIYPQMRIDESAQAIIEAIEGEVR